MTRIQNACVSSAFAAWMHELLENKRMAATVTKVSQRLHKMQETAAFNAWQHYTHESKHMKTVAAKIVLRMAQGGMHRCFVALYEYADGAKTTRALLKRFFGREERKRLYKSMGAWRECVPAK